MTNKTLMGTLRLSLILTLVAFSTIALAQHETLDEAFAAKKPELELLWQVSMNQKNTDCLTGDLHASNWDEIKAQSKTIKEIAALVVRDEHGDIHLTNMSMGDKSSGSISFATMPGETIIGRFHTHPYEYSSLENMPFSPRDFVDLYMFNRDTQLKDGYFSLIKAGSKYYALVVNDSVKAKAYFQAQEKLAKEKGLSLFDYMYKKFYSVNKGTDIVDIQKNSLKFIIGSPEESGIELLER